MLKFGSKIALFEYFCPKMPYLGIFGLECLNNYCHIWNQHPQICLIAKFRQKTKMPKFGTKNALFGCFWAKILKRYRHISNAHPQIYQKWVFNSYMNFSIGFAFSKSPGSAFSEGLRPFRVRFTGYTKLPNVPMLSMDKWCLGVCYL